VADWGSGMSAYTRASNYLPVQTTDGTNCTAVALNNTSDYRTNRLYWTPNTWSITVIKI